MMTWKAPVKLTMICWMYRTVPEEDEGNFPRLAKFLELSSSPQSLRFAETSGRIWCPQFAEPALEKQYLECATDVVWTLTVSMCSLTITKPRYPFSHRKRPGWVGGL